MKIPFLFFSLFLLISTPALAQDELPTYHNELSLSFGTAQLASSPFAVLTPHTRLMYRRHLGDFALRAQFERLDFNYSTNDNGYFPSIQNSIGAYVGLQYGREKGRLSYYGFLDLGYGILDLYSPGSRRYSSERIKGLKSQAGLGLGFRLGKHWKLGLESALTYIYGNVSGTSGGVDVYDPAFIRIAMVESRGGQLIFNPLQAFWISYSFGQSH